MARSGAPLAVRPATWDDRAIIAGLVGGSTTHGHWRAAFGAALQSSGDRVLVAERGNLVVGVAHLTTNASLFAGRREARIGTLVVPPGPGGAEVRMTLLDAADRAAVLLGCDVVIDATGERGAAGGGDLVDRFLAAAARAATAVAGVLAAGGEQDIGIGADGLATKAVDRACEAVAVAVLAELDLPILSEEAGAVGGRTPRRGAPWLALDPLDGTRNFTRRHPPWAIAIGLIVDGAPLAGFVADHSSGRRWWGAPGAGAWADGRPAVPRWGGLLIVPGSTGREPPPTLPAGFDRIRMAGATTVELCRVADGAAGAFADVDRGVVRVHDLAGPMAILLGAGCTVRTVDGKLPVLRPDALEVHRIVATAPASDSGSITRDVALASVRSS